MKRQHQFVLIGSALALSWLAMQAVHELGHVLGAIVSGGGVAQVMLHPTAISYTRLAENPHPVLASWAGPIVGVAVPFGAWLFARACRMRGWFLLQFFAGFCLVANGAYLGIGSFGGIGDAGDLLRLGTPIALLWLFGLTTIPLGFWLWNGLRPHFGWGASDGDVDPVIAYVSLGLFVATVILELAFA